jgi:hypothetical protein
VGWGLNNDQLDRAGSGPWSAPSSGMNPVQGGGGCAHMMWEMSIGVVYIFSLSIYILVCNPACIFLK